MFSGTAGEYHFEKNLAAGRTTDLPFFGKGEASVVNGRGGGEIYARKTQ
jgi:hypothetical protein